MTDAGESPGADDGQPAFRLTHLMEDIADVFAARDSVQMIAPLERGGVKPRTNNRVQFSVTDPDRSPDDRAFVSTVLETEQFAWTHGPGTGVFVVLGRQITDLRELRKDDRIHINSRGGPFKVARVMDHSPEVLRRSDPAVTVELSNVDTGTDWMMVQWDGADAPVIYVRTQDTNSGVRGSARFKKVEAVDRMGRIGPRRRYSADVENTADIHELVRTPDTSGWIDTHPMDSERVLNLTKKPASEAFSPEDANTIQRVLADVAEAYERQADALHITTDEDKAHARQNQTRAKTSNEFANCFDLANMDTVTDTEDADLWICEDCGAGYTNKHRYPTHRRDCPAKEEQDDE